MSARYNNVKNKWKVQQKYSGLNEGKHNERCLNKIFRKFKCILTISSFPCKRNLFFFFFEIDITTIFSWIFNLIQDGLFRSCSKMGSKKVPFSKICHTYPTIMKLDTAVRYLKRIHKIYKSRETPHDLCWYQLFFHRKSATFVISRNADNCFNGCFNRQSL